MNPFTPFHGLFNQNTYDQQMEQNTRTQFNSMRDDGRSVGDIVEAILNKPTHVRCLAYYHGPGIPPGKLAPYLRGILK